MEAQEGNGHFSACGVKPLQDKYHMLVSLEIRRHAFLAVIRL